MAALTAEKDVANEATAVGAGGEPWGTEVWVHLQVGSNVFQLVNVLLLLCPNGLGYIIGRS